ncbi:MAG: alpha/beta fold hydrolase [Pseudomonadales bacterium]|nr:alpha/beta fold hydrolase [Pseudomonadales bacterium]
MNLEVISNFSSQPSQHPPLVLIHGGWHGAWCWKGNFLEYFAENGWDVHAISLRGHGNSEGKEKLRWWSIADYVADADQFVKTLARPPILVGHSMGGFVTQKYLENHSVPGAVLLASVPHTGLIEFSLRIIKKHPLIWLKMYLLMSAYPLVKNPIHAKEWFFSSEISTDALARHHALLQDEGSRSVVDMLFFNLPKPSMVTSPIAVIGAEKDAVFSVAEIEGTARAYGVKPKIFANTAHDMMLEPNWQNVAAWIADWAEQLSINLKHEQKE